ncbi:hypothetical protein D3C79_983630 [compost metagenome]
MRATLYHFDQSKRLLLGLALYALRLGVILLQLFMLLRVALQHRQQGFQLDQGDAVLLNMARGILRLFQLFTDFFHPVLQGIVVQQ